MSRALDTFWDQQQLADQLVKKCKSDSGGNEGHDALSRAAVVFCVAFWQAYVENVVIEAYEKIGSKIRSSNADETIILKKFIELNEKLLEDRIEFFNTPNSKNVRDLLKLTLNVNPNDFWTEGTMIIDSKKGARSDAKKYKGGSIQAELNSWLNVRHSIAHGDDQIKDIGDGTKMNFPLTDNDLRNCIDFFNFLAEHTDDGIDSHLKSEFNIALNE